MDFSSNRKTLADLKQLFFIKKQKNGRNGERCVP